MIPRCHGLVPLTDSVARRHLRQVSTIMQVIPHFKFHDFRRAGSTWAFHFSVPLDEIKAHGTWASDCVWRYIFSVTQSFLLSVVLLKYTYIPSLAGYVSFLCIYPLSLPISIYPFSLPIPHNILNPCHILHLFVSSVFGSVNFGSVNYFKIYYIRLQVHNPLRWSSLSHAQNSNSSISLVHQHGWFPLAKKCHY